MWIGAPSEDQDQYRRLYSLPRLPVGNYEVRVEASGFQTAVHAAFSLELNQTARLDFAMTLGQVSQIWR